tara:strand:- start:189 stop:989 length:801 start_codon:yes stop_codon:yes gene_type:complete
MININTPISTLWDSDKNRKIIFNNSNSFEGRPFNNFIYPEGVIDKITTFHCDIIQPIHNLSSEDYKYVKKIVELHPNLEYISFHCAFRSKNTFSKKGIAYPNGYIFSKKELISNAKQNITKLKEILGDIKILIENNNYYPTKAYGIVTNGDFISTIVYENNIEFLFDQAHAEITAHNKKISFNSYVDSLPMDKCKQVHLCKMGYSDSLYSKDFYLAKDLHLPLTTKEVDKLNLILKKSNNVKYFTIECYKKIDDFTNSVKILKNND